MKRFRILGACLEFLSLALLAAPLAAQTEIPLANWKVPLYNGVDVTSSSATAPASSHSAMHALGDIGFAVPFVAVTPCRVVNTRNANGPFGGPLVAGSSSRNFDLNGNGACPGIPDGAFAYSINVTAADTLGPGFLKLYPTGGAVPVVSTVNYGGAGLAVANAAIVPAGSGGAVTVTAGVSGANVIIDINGYFSPNLNNGNFLDVQGTYDSAFEPGGIAYFQNNTTGPGYSVNSSIASSAAGSASLNGFASGEGEVSGVRGETSSTSFGASGVLGISGTQLVNQHIGTAGVIGNSGTYSGVLGISKARGVQGSHTDASGNILTAGILGFFGNSGVHSFEDVTAGGTKPFVVPYAGKPDRQIMYVAVEADEVLTATRGRVHLDRGLGVIQLPTHFLMVTEPEGWTVQLTPVGDLSSLAVVKVDAEKGQIVIKGSRSGIDVFYRVEGVRKGYKDFQPVQNNIYFVPGSAAEKMPPWPSETRRILIQNGIYGQDGAPNLETARALGWAEVWEERAKSKKALQKRGSDD